MLEARLMVAYALIALIVIVASVSGTLWTRRRRAHQRRMRGIKSYTPAGNRSAAQ